MTTPLDRKVFYIALAYIAVTSVLIGFEIYQSLLLPPIVLLVYLAIKRPDIAFFILALGSPLSVNSEEFMAGPMAMFVPTEPVMMLLLFIYFCIEVIKPGTFNEKIFKHPIFKVYMIYLAWMVVTSLTSMMPGVSIKFFIAHCWLFFPVFIFGVHYFKKKENIYKFFFLFNLALVSVAIYTIINHSFYAFTEKPAHWVMSPFYKDHTSYGAILAIGIPLVVGLISTGRYKGKVKLFLQISVFVLIAAIILSYTRAAWLSLVAALLIWPILVLRIKWQTIVLIAGFGLAMLFMKADRIMMTLGENTTDSSADFGKHLTSMTNISTDASNVERLNRWDCAISMFKQKPLTGWGPGTYQFFYAPFQKPQYMTIISTYFGDGGNAHSEYLGPMADSGILGLFTILAVVVVIYIRIFRNFNRTNDPVLQKFYLSAIIGVTTYFIHGFLNNYLDTDKAAVPVWGIAALIAAIDLYHSKQDNSEKV